MKQKWLIQQALGVVACFLVSIHCFTVYAAETFPFGSKLPAFQLNMPKSPEIEAYLKMKDVKTFYLAQIPAKLILVEFFTVFCPICQESVPTYNRLYRVIKDDQRLNKDIKMIGIALLSKPNEVALFKEKFKVEYPLFADPQREIKKRTNVNLVPLTVVIDKNGKVIMGREGMIKDLDAFLLELRNHHKALSI